MSFLGLLIATSVSQADHFWFEVFGLTRQSIYPDTDVFGRCRRDFSKNFSRHKNTGTSGFRVS